MSLTAILIIAAFIFLLIAGGKPLIRNRWYRDYILFAVLIAWSAFIAVSLVMHWPTASSGTSIAASNAVFRPFGRMLHAMIGIEPD